LRARRGKSRTGSCSTAASWRCCFCATPRDAVYGLPRFRLSARKPLRVTSRREQSRVLGFPVSDSIRQPPQTMTSSGAGLPSTRKLSLPQRGHRKRDTRVEAW
jgi:hypothetical protein